MSDETPAADLEQLAGMYAGMTTAALVILRHAFKADEAAAGGASAPFARGRLAVLDAEFKRRAIAAPDASTEPLTFSTEPPVHPVVAATIDAARAMGLPFKIDGTRLSISVSDAAFAYNLGLQAMVLVEKRAAAARRRATAKRKKTPTRRARTTARRVTPKKKRTRR